jgi:hypothetical protein
MYCQLNEFYLSSFIVAKTPLIKVMENQKKVHIVPDLMCYRMYKKSLTDVHISIQSRNRGVR